MFCSVQKPYLLILANLQSNKRLKRETLRFSRQFFAYMHLSKREIYHAYKKLESFSGFFSSLDQSSCISLFGQVTAWSQNCMTGVVERSLSQSQILKNIQDKNTVVPREFLMVFGDEIMTYKGELRLVL